MFFYLDIMDSNDFKGALKRLENVLQSEPDQEQHTVSSPFCIAFSLFERLTSLWLTYAAGQRFYHVLPNSKIQAIRRAAQRFKNELSDDSTSCFSKRKRENDSAIEGRSALEMEAKKRRILPHKASSLSNDMGESEEDFAISMRNHLVSLHQAFQAHWTCECQRCSSLGVRLSLPQRKMNSQMETTFEVFFGIQSESEVVFQEAKITVK